MKSTEFLNEIINNDSPVVIEIQNLYNITPETMKGILQIMYRHGVHSGLLEALIIIGQQCKPYLNEVRYNAFDMFRGSGSTDSWIEKSVRVTDRRTRHMNTVLKQVLNIYFKKQFGGEFRHALFCTGDVRVTGLFGNAYYIFPKGEYTYLWSPKVDDLNYEFGRYRDNELKHDRYNYSDSESTLYSGFVNKHLPRQDFKTTDLPQGLYSGHEIMIRCKEYVGIEWKNDDDKRVAGMQQILKLVGRS